MIKIEPSTERELDELVEAIGQDGLPEVFYRSGYQLISPLTGRPVGGGGISSTTFVVGDPGTPAGGGGGGSP